MSMEEHYLDMGTNGTNWFVRIEPPIEESNLQAVVQSMPNGWTEYKPEEPEPDRTIFVGGGKNGAWLVARHVRITLNSLGSPTHANYTSKFFGY